MYVGFSREVEVSRKSKVQLECYMAPTPFSFPSFKASVADWVTAESDINFPLLLQ